jgi:N-acetylglucosaminyl-diphospho-decaprenol L-rhamnosyltransferase
MSISRQTLTIVIVTFKSEKVIDNCIKSISDQIKIIIVDNSNDQNFKDTLEKKYENVECILSSSNLGMGSGNNLGLNNVKTEYALILNPDVILRDNTISEIIKESKKIDSFAVLAPLSENDNNPNYKIKQIDKKNINILNPFKVESVDGFAMLLNLKKINQIPDFQNKKYFDENFFMYLENDDFCKRLSKCNQNIFIIPKSRIKHLGAKAVSDEYAYEVELSRNWHWIWSKFYFNKKHFGFLYALMNGLPVFLSAITKVLFYFFINKKKKQIYLQRCRGYLNALFGKKSFYRPKINF